MLYRIRDIGESLITGLWNGMSDKFSWLTARIRSFAGDVLGSIKRFFGISSPSKRPEGSVISSPRAWLWASRTEPRTCCRRSIA